MFNKLLKFKFYPYAQNICYSLSTFWYFLIKFIYKRMDANDILKNLQIV